jgi:hypothetical protein
MSGCLLRGNKQCFLGEKGFNAAFDYAISPEGRHQREEEKQQ